MALDHYISQVHLKNFYAPSLGNRMFALRKADMKSFATDAKSVCRIKEGNTNPYLAEPRAIEEFLKKIEPKYNAAVKDLTEKNVGEETIYVLAGFIAYVHSCSPAGMRIHSATLERTLSITSQLLDAQGKLPTPPPSISDSSLTELLTSGRIHFNIDPKYPQSVGVTSILDSIKSFSNLKWEVLINDTDSPFFTSDFPIAIEPTPDPRIINKIIPLTPRLAIRLHPNFELKTRDTIFLQNFSCSFRSTSRQEVIKINTAIVRCAEELVFFCEKHEWVEPFIQKNAPYRIENVIQNITNQNSTLLLASLRIVRF